MLSELFYQKLVRPILFKVDPETIHDIVLAVGGKLCKCPMLECGLRSVFEYEDEKLAVQLFGRSFKNPFGLAAGFDKNCVAVEFFSALGFGHVEVGTITFQPQPGNPRPRIFRFPADQALINRMGFPSEGAEMVASRLEAISQKTKSCLLGINFGKTKVVPVDDALADYLATFERIKNLGDYFVLNVSSPNTPELRKLQEKERLEALFQGVKERNSANKPILVKIAPDLSEAEVDGILDVAMRCGVSGLIATNTTIGREGLSCKTEEQGGLSGKPLREKSLKMVSYIYRRTQGRIPIIGVGGVFDLSDAVALVRAGASMIQLYTGFIYQGPWVINKLKKEMVSYLKVNGVGKFQDLIGLDVK